MKKINTHLIAALVFAMAYLPAFAQPVANFTVSGNPNKCEGVAYTFTNTSTGANSYNWDFGDGNSSTATSPTHAYTMRGTHIVTLTASDGSNTSVKKIAVFVKNDPSAYFNIAGYNDKYPGDLIHFENFSSHYTSVNWNFGDGVTSTRTNPKHTYTTPGTKTITLTVSDGCGQSSQYNTDLDIIDTATVEPRAYISNYTTLACPGEELTFGHDSRFATSVKWDFGDGNSITTQKSEVKYIYNNIGVYTVKLYAYRKAKVDSAEFTIQITDTLINMGYSNVGPYRLVNGNYRIANCIGAPFTFSGYPNNGQTAYWRLSNGVMLNNPDTNYAFSAHGTYQAWFIVQNMCGAKDSTEYTLYVLPSDTFTSTPGYINVNPMMGYVCPGGKMKFSTSIWENDVTVQWKINDTLISTSNDFEHIFGNYEAMHTVKLIRNRSCGLSDSVTQNVFTSNLANPTLGFNFNGNTSQNSPNCYKDTVKFSTSDFSIDYTLNPVNHFWDFGDGTTSTQNNPIKIYNTDGWHSIIHRVTNSCGISAEEALTLYTTSDKAPMVRFYAYPERICAGDSTMIDNFTLDADSMVVDYGDGQRKIIVGWGFPHDFHKYSAPGVYTAKVYAYNRCSGDTGQVKITVLDGPNSYIIMNDTSVTPGTSLTFTRFAGNAERHIWFRSSNIADTTSANSFTRTFTSAGTYKVYLLSFNELGCSKLDSVTINVQIPGAVSSIAAEKATVKVYPNPTQSDYTFDLKLENNADVSIELYDLNGKRVAALFNDKLIAGEHTFSSNVSILPDGIYICHIRVNGSVTHQKLVKQ
jgi:PKD repeat protein